ncbi:MAG: acyl-CoA thioesterase II [Pseudohongiellaceae bacterium]|nr:acyl-CoA thioesterase II [Pseudohongiellaceae bacterium]
MPSNNGSDQLTQLYDHLNLQQIEENLYETTHKNEGWKQIYGGQVLAQALLSASNTVPTDRQVHSLHSYFLRPGIIDQPIRFQVDRIRDGRSFSTRRVTALQNDKAILNLAASFQIQEEGLSYQAEAPKVKAPEECLTRLELAQKYADFAPKQSLKFAESKFAIDLRLVEPENVFAPQVAEPHRAVWIKLNDTLPADYGLHSHILAYASDLTILETALRPHGISLFEPKLQIASLDHAMWFHRSFRVDEWLLYVQDSPASANSRGFGRGSIFTRDGKLVVSVAQEGLMRMRD